MMDAGNKLSGRTTTFFVSSFLALAFTTLSLSHSLQAQEIKIGFYNVENLFDTIDASGTYDEEFTPNGDLYYGKKRYEAKLTNISRVINEGFGAQGPAILGLCEVENKRVVEDLVLRFNEPKEYEIIHVESPDQRGIDNALVIRLNEFEVMEHGSRTVQLQGETRPTRDILFAVLKDRSTQAEVIVFVNHWPSRYGGADASEWKRLSASAALVQEIEKQRNLHPDAAVIAMGDFNDYPRNQSVLRLEKCDDNTDPCLMNTHRHIHGTGKGSHAYKGEWGMLDQILVDQLFLESEFNLRTTPEGGDIISFSWMYYENKDGEMFPSRTYGGTRYYGGYSDHLPVMLTLERAQ